MEFQDEVLDALRQAVELSPESGPLRRHFAEMLLNRGYARQAETEFRKAIDLDDLDAPSKLGLARALHSQGQNSTALLLVKQVIRESDRPAKAYILYARLLLALGSVERAVREYRKAIATDPEAVDPDLASELGLAAIRSEPSPPAADDGDETRPSGASAPDAEPISELDLEISPAEAYTHRLRRLFAAHPRITFQHVSGLEAVKQELNAMLVHPLNNRQHYRAYEKSLGGRLLMFGPPGCGKTYLARAVAGEVLAPFLAVHIHDLVDQWQTQSGRMLHEIFEQARDMSPSVLFFDDVETAGTDRPVSRQLLHELRDPAANDSLLVLVATSAPWDADPDLLAPGAFDRVLFLGPPTRADRLDFLRRLCAGKPQGNLDLPTLAGATEGYSFLDLKRVVDRALDDVLRRSLDQGRPQPLTRGDLESAIAAIQPSLPPWLEEAREHLPPRGQDSVYRELRSYLDAFS
ncbi:MAG: AAA family ATPase [Acidobacteria bacterium]|nr:AAA family ATPase [Acidobacteriota bacterium]